ncbi:hypothetical protein BGZ88_000952 [Linnemannia elongata]|nr:hypothetical protein BGZ88_000952 [Linnemannia elongata]
MSMINWTGNVPFDRLEQRMNQVFDQLINPWTGTFMSNIPASRRKISKSTPVTALSAESKFSQDYGRDNMRYQERRFGAFRRTIPLPGHVDRDNIDANFKGGVLSLFLPKGEAVQARRLPSLK